MRAAVIGRVAILAAASVANAHAQCCVATAAAGCCAPATIRAARSVEPMRIDGRLDEHAWMQADSISDLTQVEPHEGGRPSGRTVVRVLVTADAIVVGVRVDYPVGVDVVRFARDRDAKLDNEDYVKIVLDTYLDGRSGYVFAINAYGARYDALINPGGDENSNWDTVWEAATARTITGWTAEIQIPFKSILSGQRLTSWGLNVQRRIQALQETDRWAGAAQNISVTQTSRAGRLEGLPPVNIGLGLSIRPAVTAGGGYPAPDSALDRRADLSVDVTQRVGANTLASLTVNTDFAETEVDTRRTNLTRFPLFFPEKRTFFLEGSDIFEFGLGLGDDLHPFQSRTVGLIGDRRVPIEVGGKVDGRLGATNFGALVVHTGPVDDSVAAPATTIGVVRVKRNVLAESSVGMIGTFGDPLGRGRSWLAGPDATFQTSRFRGTRNLLIGAWGLAMGRDSLPGVQHAFGGQVAYPNDVLELSLSYKWLDDGFQPPLGFVSRSGVQLFSLSTNYQPRPSRPVGPLRVRQMFFEHETTVATDLAGRWESYRVFMAPINWRLESGDRFEFNVVPQGERLTDPFEISEHVTIPASTYSFTRFRLEGGLAAKRPFSGQYTWWFGRFYDGYLDQFQITSSWKASALLIVELNAEHDVGRLRAGRFTEDVVGTRLHVNVSANLQLNTYVQYDNTSHLLGTNTRLRWAFSPVGDLFVVYNHNISDTDAVTGARRLAFSSSQLLMKAQYALRY